MEIKQILFDIPYPINLFEKKIINFLNKKKREILFKRNIYYYSYKENKNHLLEKRWKIFFALALKVKEFMVEKYSKLKILNISIFGSALHSPNNDDYDFLIIVKGNLFENIMEKIILDNKEYSVGISIKGEENLSKGGLGNNASFDADTQMKIINRTSISLPYRHLPIIGFDFKENKKIFLENCHAEIYDLLTNAYNRYYLDNKNNLSSNARARKIFSRLFEALKYASLVSSAKEIKDFQKKIISKRRSKGNLFKDSKQIFREFVCYYNNFLEKD